MKKAITIFTVCILCLFTILPRSGHALVGHTHFWVCVLNVYYQPIATAEVLARSTKTGNYYTLTFRGWGYYNETLVPGTYDVIVNGRVLKRGVYASAFWYVFATCFL